MTATARAAAAILERHASGWRCHIGWPETHQPTPLEKPKPTGRPASAASKWRSSTIAKINPT